MSESLSHIEPHTSWIEQFRLSVEANKGHVHIIIHPYPVNNDEVFFGTDQDQYSYNQEIHDKIEQLHRERKPIVLFIDAKKEEVKDTEIYNLYGNNEHIVFIPTYPDDPLPIDSYVSQMKALEQDVFAVFQLSEENQLTRLKDIAQASGLRVEQSAHTDELFEELVNHFKSIVPILQDGVWDAVSHLFNTLGVRKATIHGRNLVVNQRDEYFACVGEVLKQLKRRNIPIDMGVTKRIIVEEPIF